jgi:hypothetical protein
LDTPPTNDLIGQLEERLSPDGWQALEEITALEPDAANAEPEASLDEALGILRKLPDTDRQLVSQVLQLRGRAHESRAEEYMEDAKQARLAAGVIERAQALEHAAGRELEESMPLGEALEILRAHGEPAPEHLDAGRLVELSGEQSGTIRTGKISKGDYLAAAQEIKARNPEIAQLEDATVAAVLRVVMIEDGMVRDPTTDPLA